MVYRTHVGIRSTKVKRQGNIMHNQLLLNEYFAQTLESLTGFNTSDRTPAREFTHSGFTGHKGAYFGKGRI